MEHGGYNVLMSMSRGNASSGLVWPLQPVTDWRLYDTVYTERFMRTPQQNNDGYQQGSPIALAGQLQGDLLLIHGTADDNVHFQIPWNIRGRSFLLTNSSISSFFRIRIIISQREYQALPV